MGTFDDMDNDDLFSSSPSASPPPAPPRARPPRPTNAALSSPARKSLQRSLPSSSTQGDSNDISSQAVGIGVPRTLVKPFRLPFPRKRLWDGEGNDGPDAQPSQGSSSSASVRRHLSHRRLGMTPARYAPKPVPATIYIPKRVRAAPQVDEDEDPYMHSDPLPLSSSLRKSKKATPSTQARRHLRARPTLSPLTEDDLNADYEDLHRECLEQGSDFEDAPGSSSAAQQHVPIAVSATRKTGLGHFEWAEDFTLEPRSQAAILPHRHGAGATLGRTGVRDINAEYEDDHVDAEDGPIPGYSSPQVKPRSSGPNDQYSTLDRLHSATPEQHSGTPSQHVHVPPSSWSHLPEPEGHRMMEHAYINTFRREECGGMSALESEGVLPGCTQHSVNELTKALRSNSIAYIPTNVDRCASIDADCNARAMAGMTSKSHGSINLEPAVQDDFGLGGFERRRHIRMDDGIADCQDQSDLDHGWSEDSHARNDQPMRQSRSTEDDNGLNENAEASEEDDSTELPSMASLQQSMRIRVVASRE